MRARAFVLGLAGFAWVCMLSGPTWAQTSSRSGALAQGSPPREAPVGHRQPKASEVPQAQELTDAEKKQKELDEALNKKLKGICRGC